MGDEPEAIARAPDQAPALVVIAADNDAPGIAAAEAAAARLAT